MTLSSKGMVGGVNTAICMDRQTRVNSTICMDGWGYILLYVGK